MRYVAFKRLSAFREADQDMSMQSTSPTKHKKARLCINIYLLLDSCACETRYLASLLGFRSVPEILDLPQRRRGTSRQEMMLYERNPPLI